MNDKTIGTTLKNAREAAGLSLEYVSQFLSEKGHKAALKTMYGWENNKSLPRIDAFLDMCDLYKINDILVEFGYSSRHNVVEITEIKMQTELINAFHNLNDIGKDTALHQVKAMSGIHPKEEPPKKSNIHK